MKRLKTAVVKKLAAIAERSAKAFAAAPCGGPIYEPKMPEKLKKD